MPKVAGRYQAKVEIVLATMRDVTFVCANMRDEDWREIGCQVSRETDREHIAALCFSGESWVARIGEQPVAAFGLTPVTVSVANVWAFGTRAMWRAVPAMTRFIRARVPEWIASGITRVEARSIEGHHTAHRWMRGLGASETPLPCWGRDGEDFVLFSWTRDRWRAVST